MPKKLGAFKRILLYTGTVLILMMSTIGLSTYAADQNRSIFTDKEQEWLNANPVIRVAPDDDYAPIEYMKDGEFVGLSMDYLKWVQDTYNIKFELVFYETWTEILEAVKTGEVHLQTGIIKTPDRLEYLSFTEPYTDMPTVCLKRKDFEEKLTIDTLFNYRVGLLENFAVHEYVKLVYSPEVLYPFNSVSDALVALSIGSIDALILDLGQATYYVKEMALSNITIADNIHIDFKGRLSWATPKDQAILAEILNKALKSMPTSAKNEISDKWLNIGKYSWFDKQLLNVAITLLGILGMVLLFVMVWIRSLHKKDMQLRDVNQQLALQIEQLHLAQKQLIELEKINALSRLIIGVAHEVNTPLGNGICATSYLSHCTELLTTQLKEQSDCSTQTLDLVNDIAYSSERVLVNLQQTSKIIEDFKLVAASQGDDLRVVVLDEEIRRMIEIMTYQQNFKCEIKLNLQPSLEVTMPNNSLFQLLTSLIENCCIHAYKQSAGLIEINLSEHDTIITLSVKDFGVGIPDDLVEKIFEPFFTTNRGSQSTGLGLYSVYNIATQLLKGSVTVKSTPTEGTEFSVTFSKTINS